MVQQRRCDKESMHKEDRHQYCRLGLQKQSRKRESHEMFSIYEKSKPRYVPQRTDHEM